MRHIKPDARERRDARERAATCYCTFTRCLGGHVTPAMFVCQHCESHDPHRICFKERVRKASEKPSDWSDPRMQKRVSKFEIV